MWSMPTGPVRRTFVIALAAGALGLAVATALPLFGERWWYADLFSHFRFHYLAAATLAALVALALRAWPLAVVFLLLTGPHLEAVLHPFRSTPAAAASVTGQTLRIATINVEWKNRQKDSVLRFVRETRPDLVVIQEAVPGWHATVERLASQFPYIAPANWRREPQNILLSKFPVLSARVQHPGPSYSNYLQARLRVGGKTVTVLAIHPPTPLNQALTAIHRSHFAAYRAAVGRAPGPVIIAGDFNLTPWSPRFRTFLARTKLSIADPGLAWPRTFPARTRYNVSDRLLPGIPIDHILVSRHFAVKHVRRGPFVGSDHYPLVADLVLKPVDK